MSKLFLNALGIAIGLCLRHNKGNEDELQNEEQERLWQESDWEQ